MSVQYATVLKFKMFSIVDFVSQGQHEMGAWGPMGGGAFPHMEVLPLPPIRTKKLQKSAIFNKFLDCCPYPALGSLMPHTNKQTNREKKK